MDVAPVELTVSEVFGPTFQGEGPSLGTRAGFVRLGRCNLACAWCDTPYTWDWSRYSADDELTTRTVDSIVGDIVAMAVPLVVVTGGEPLLQQARLAPLVDAFDGTGLRVEVETNGTVAPTLDVDQWNVSPKLANSGMPLERRIRPDVLAAFERTERAVFKFAVAATGDLDEIDLLVREHGLTNIWIMPVATDASTLTRGVRDLAPAVLDRGWNLTTRLHILVWGDRRGV